MSHAAHAVVLQSWPAASAPVWGRGSWPPYTHPPTHKTCPRRLSPGRWPSCTHSASCVCLLARRLTPAPPSPSLAPGRPPAGMGEAHFAHGMCRACFLEFFSATGGLYAGHNPPAFEAARERERRVAEAAAAAAQARGALAGGEQVLALPAPPGALRGGDGGGKKGWGSLRCAALCLRGFFCAIGPAQDYHGAALLHMALPCAWAGRPALAVEPQPRRSQHAAALHAFTVFSLVASPWGPCAGSAASGGSGAAAYEREEQEIAEDMAHALEGAEMLVGGCVVLWVQRCRWVGDLLMRRCWWVVWWVQRCRWVDLLLSAVLAAGVPRGLLCCEGMAGSGC